MLILCCERIITTVKNAIMIQIKCFATKIHSAINKFIKLIFNDDEQASMESFRLRLSKIKRRELILLNALDEEERLLNQICATISSIIQEN